jgi:uncharacterized membrane protein YfcA
MFMNIWPLLLVSVAGFFAQLIDGSMGMAFGVSATSLLLLLAYNPAAASAIVHLAEVATTAVSGVSHIRFGNVHWPTLLKIAIPGALAAFAGAVLLSNLDLSAARPWTSGILLALGIVIIARFVRARVQKPERTGRKRWLVPLGLVGGFVDSTGGGGWGPVVTSSLTASRVLEPRKAIGTTNTAEFLVALSASVGFLLGLGSSAIPWDAVIALIIGGVLAAPLAAWLLTKVPQQILGLVVGFVIVLLNTRQIAVSFEVPGGVLWTLLALVAVAGIVTVVNVVRRKKSVR